MVDSIANISPKVVQEKDVDATTMAIIPRLMSTHLPYIIEDANKTGTSILFLNQIRASLNPYGPSTSIPGGKAIGYNSSIILQLKRKEIIKDHGEEVGILASIKATKNKVGAPFKEKEVNILFPHLNETTGKFVAGIDPVSDVIDAAIELDIIKKGGAWFKFTANSEDFNINGKDKIKELFITNTPAYEDIKQQVFAQVT